jgi:hypothetical protein
MNFPTFLIVTLVGLVILERVLLRLLTRKRQLSFRVYYLLVLYKPLFIVAAFIVLAISAGKGWSTLGVLIVMGLGSVLVSYPTARFFYARMPQHEVRGNGLGE